MMDNKPFGDLHQILQELADDRIWVFAEWVSSPAVHLRWLCRTISRPTKMLRCCGA